MYDHVERNGTCSSLLNLVYIFQLLQIIYSFVFIYPEMSCSFFPPLENIWSYHILLFWEFCCNTEQK